VATLVVVLAPVVAGQLVLVVAELPVPAAVVELVQAMPVGA